MAQKGKKSRRKSLFQEGLLFILVSCNMRPFFGRIMALSIGARRRKVKPV